MNLRTPARSSRESYCAILLKWLGLHCPVWRAMSRANYGGDKHSSNACWTGERNFLRKALVVDKAPLSSLAFKIHICVPSPWIFTWNKGALLKLDTNFFFKDLCRVSSLQLSGICMRSWIWNFRSLSWSVCCIKYLEYLTFEWVHATSKPLPQLYYHDCSGRIPRAPQVGFELIYIPAGKLKGSLESLLIFKTMYSFYLNAHKTTMSCIKHFMRVEFSES